jgi:PGF-pre-PGF domain-containing protein
MKKSVLLIASILLLISTGAAAPSVVPSSSSVKVGENVTVNISVNPDNLDVFGAQFSLVYISSILNATSIVKGKFLTQDEAGSIVVKSVCDNAISRCDYAETRVGVKNGVTTPGTIATITFRAVAAGTVPLKLIDVMMTNSSPADISGLIVNNGSVTVSSSPTPTPTPTISGNSGGGGGGITSGEDFNNIEKQDRKDAFVYAGKLTSFQFSDAGPIEFINFTGKKNLGETTVKVEVLKNTSTLVNQTPPGAVYRNINLWVGTSGFARPENIEHPVVRFNVENAWLSSNNFAAGDVALLRWNNSAWSRLETIQVGKNDMYTFFEAGTDYFSPFAISAKKSTQSVAAALPANAERIQETSGTPAAPAQKTPGFESVPVMAMLITVYMFSRKR